MKTKKILNIVLAFVVSIAFFSCVEDDDYSIPNNLGEVENVGLQEILAGIASGDIDPISITELKSMYDGDLPHQVDTDIVVKGYVSSSDKTGNFYKEIYLQDNFENPTSAIKVIFNQTDMYNLFNKGREVYIRLNPPNPSDLPTGLYIGEERVGNGVIAIGAGTETDQYGTTVTSLGETRVETHMFRSPNTMDIVPLNLSFNEISEAHIGMFVQIDGVEFADNLDGERYFDPLEDFDTQRIMQACTGFSYSNFVLETSSFSDFKSEFLPTGNGSIAGIIAKNYFGDMLLMALNSTDDVNFDDSRCSLLNIEDFSIVYEEDFEEAVDGTDLDLGDLINYAEFGSRVWREEVRDNNGYAEFNPYSSGDANSVAWLITPEIELDNQENEILSFTSAYGYPDDGHYPMELFISSDFDGTEGGIDTATWEPLTAIFSHPDVSDWWDFVGSGNVDLSSYTGTAYIAFRYTGSDTNDQNMTFRLDNVKVLGEVE